MRMLHSKKLLVSTLIFLFSNYNASMTAEILQIESSSQSTQDGIEPLVHLSPPRIVDISLKGQTDQKAKALIQSVDYHHSLTKDLKDIKFSYQDIFTVVNESYGNTLGGYVNLTATDLESGLIHIQNPQNTLEKNLRLLLGQPQQFHVRSDILNPQLSPKIITETTSKSQMLLIEPWDFRLAKKPSYNQVAIDSMFTNIYSTFKAYCQMMKKQAVIHTGFWGVDYHNNPRVTTAIQYISATVAGIKEVYFHIPTASDDHQAILLDVKEFMNGMSNKNLLEIAHALLAKTQDPQWNAQEWDTQG